MFGLRPSNLLNLINCRTKRYSKSFYPDTVTSWNNIGPELRGAKSLAVFKANVLKIIRPAKKDTFNIHNSNELRWIFLLRVGLSPLNRHKNLHNFQDTPNDTCQCQLDAETTKHFLLKCPSYNPKRYELFEKIKPILVANNLHDLNDDDLVILLLYGHHNLKFHENQFILKSTIRYIGKSERFSQL